MSNRKRNANQDDQEEVPNPKIRVSDPAHILDSVYQQGERVCNDGQREIASDAFLEWLPFEILLKIFNCTHTIDLIELAKTSKLFFFYARDEIRQRKMLPMYHPINLTYDQDRVLAAVARGDSVFCTGTAGTGKSHLIHAITNHMKRQKKYVLKCAPTGTASYLIHGATLHSTLGPTFLLHIQTDAELDNSIAHGNCFFYSACDVLIIDEISMVAGADLSLLDRHFRHVKGKKRLPFGGVQVILFGDFCQIKPFEEGASYCFKSSIWEVVFSENSYRLLQVVRQKSRRDVQVLNDVRSGRLTVPTMEVLNDMKKRPIFPNAPFLFTRTRKVDEFTKEKMKSTPGTAYEYRAQDIGGSPPDIVPQVLLLKTNVRVMLRKNFNSQDGLCNGTMGTVVRFESAADIEEQIEHNERRQELEYPVDEDTVFAWLGEVTDRLHRYPIVKWDHDSRLYAIGPFSFENKAKTQTGEPMRLACRKQLPICIGWAMTIDKSQGATLKQVNVDLSGIFGTGREFVALSRAVSLDAVSLRGFQPYNLKVDPEVIEFENETTWK